MYARCTYICARIEKIAPDQAASSPSHLAPDVGNRQNGRLHAHAQAQPRRTPPTRPEIDDDLFHFPDDEKALEELVNGPRRPPEALGRSTPITIRIDHVTLKRLKALAGKRGTRYQTLMKQLLLERLYEEEKRAELSDRPAC